MAVDYNTVSEKLFKVLKGHGYSVQMFDNNEGKEIIDPQQARFFYIKNPNIMVNLDQDNAEIKMHKGPTSVENIEKSIQSVRNLARDNLLDFDLREFGREIKPKNYTYRLNTNTMKDMTTESYSTLAGSTKTSSQNLENAKLLIKHRKPVDEEVPGSRSRNIKALYIENADGERFKYPFIHLNGARAMTRHVQSGGTPYDEIGQSIVEISEQLSKIREVTTIVRRSPNMQEQASSIYDSLLNRQAQLRETMKRLTTSTGYNEYIENFTAKENTEVSTEAIDKLKEKFTVSNIDSRIIELLPMIHQIHEDEINDTPTLRNRVLQNISKGPFELTPRRIGGQTDYSPDNIKKFSNKDTMMAYKLSDMAARAKDDEVSIFLARMSDKLTGQDKEALTGEDIRAIQSVLKNIKDPERMPKQDAPKQITGESELPELSQIDETFDRILGVFSDQPIVTQSNTVKVSEDISASDMMKKYTPDQRQKISAKADEMLNKEGKSRSDYKSWEAYLNAAARMLGYQKMEEDQTDEAKAKDYDKDGDIDSNDYMAARDKAIKKAMGKDSVEENPMSPEDIARIKKNPPEEMGMSNSELAGMAADDSHEFEEYKDAVHDDIKDPTSVYAGKSTQEIVAMLRKEADGIGYADVSDGDRHPSEPEWLNKIADELEKGKQETQDLSRIVHLAGIK